MSERKPRLRESAVIVLVRGHGADLEVFWVLRSDLVRYMPGFEAFVGGSVNAEDADLPVANAAGEEDRIFRACAIREAFEETGVLIGLASAAPDAGGGGSAPHPNPPAADPPTLAAARTRLLEGARFSDLAREHGWRFDGSLLTFAGRWQTPPFAPTRFDTIYFLARVPEGQEPEVRPGELASGEWVRPAEALARYRLGRAMFAAPIFHTLLALAQGDDELAARLAQAPEEARRPTRRIELQWGIVLQPMVTRPLPPATHTNAYLVGEREMALIDPGSGDPAELEALGALLDMLAAEGRQLQIVLLTHHHPDHVDGVEAVRQRYGVPVAAHAETGRHVRIDRALADGDVVPLLPGIGDWNLRVLETPGHTRGHLCFHLPRTRTLLCGDHIPGGTGTVVIDPPDGDMAAYLESLERLRQEEIDYLFPAHGAPQGAAQRRIAALIAHRQERERKVLDALSAELRPVETLLERAYDDTPRDLWPWAARSLLAHLLKLGAEGRAAREGDAWRLADHPGAGDGRGGAAPARERA